MVLLLLRSGPGRVIHSSSKDPLPRLRAVVEVVGNHLSGTEPSSAATDLHLITHKPPRR